MYTLTLFWCFAILITAFAQDESNNSTRDESNEEKDTLLLVNALFRHGDRTPDQLEEYFVSLNGSFRPIGAGQLTNKGKRKEYSLGEMLRDRYEKFLGELYTVNITESRTTDVDRTKMSLELVLAALFPPKGDQVWQAGLNWQPIPFLYNDIDDDKLLWGMKCPNYKETFLDYLNTSKYEHTNDQYRQVYQYIRDAGHKNITNIFGAAGVYDGIQIDLDLGGEMPEWAKKIYPQPLKNITAKFYTTLAGNTELRRYTSGYLLRKIIKDARNKINGELPIGRKLYLYSAHDVTVGTMLVTLGVFDNDMPPYGACVILEFHQRNNDYGFKIFYQKKTNPPKLLKMPDCAEFCPLDQFVNITKKFMPTPNMCGRDEDD